MSPLKALVIAEAIAEQNGNVNCFKEFYTNHRTTKDVFESIELSLKNMGLYDIFLKYTKLS